MKTIIILLSASICLALPDVNSLTLREQKIVWGLSIPELGALSPIVEQGIAKKEALHRSDFNNDGTVNMEDFAIFAGDYSLFMPVVKPVADNNTTTELPNYGDFNDLEFVNYYLTEYLEN